MRKLFFILIISITLLSCFTAKAPTSSSRTPANFDFSPPNRAQAGSSLITIALVKPRFIDSDGTQLQYFAPPFNDMAISMANDFEELLSAKGFTMRGPFGSRDEMVYNDKLNSSFALEVNIDLSSSQFNRRHKYDPGLGVIINPGYKMFGDIILGGNLTITASSPQYGEKIWKKNIPLEKLSFSYTGSMKWSVMPNLAQELKEDNIVYNAFARQLEKYYTQAMNLAWQQIESQEMKVVATEAKKADKKS